MTLLAPPLAQAFKSDLQGLNAGGTNWTTGPLRDWYELDLVPLRTLHSGGPATNQVITISFDHTTSSTTIPGIQELSGFTASSNVIITAGPTLSALPGVDIWSYSFTITLTDSQEGTVEFTARLSAGAHLFPGSSLNLKLPGPGQMQIFKPAAMPGTPDLALTKSGPSQAEANQVITYVLSYTNKITSPDTGYGVQVTDILPPQVTYVPNSASAAGRLVGNTLVWDLDNLSPGEFGLVTYKVRVTNDIPVTTTFANYAQIQSAQNDGTPLDNFSSVTTVVVVNPTPLAFDDFFVTGINQPLNIPAPGVLINDSNAQSGLLFSWANHGTVTFHPDGSFLYVPGTNFVGIDIFAYQAVNAGSTSGPAIVTINVTNNCHFTVSTNLIVNNDPRQCGAVVNYPAPITTGSCLPVVCSPPAGSLFPVGVTTVNCATEDGLSHSFQLTVVDVEPPSIVCPSSLEYSTDPGQCTRSNVLFEVVFSDNCPGAQLVQTAGLPSGSTLPGGTITNQFMVIDASGNSNLCSFTITINDTQLPTLTCPTDVTVNADPGACFASNVVLGNATGTDNCGPVTVSHNAPAMFPVGTNFVTWTAVDTHGNSNTCQQRVIVQDTQVPTLTCPAEVVVNAESGACFASNVTLGNATGADNCGPVTVSNNAPAQFPVGTNFVTWTATDAHGNSVTCQQRVVVQDTQLPTLTCPADVTVTAHPGLCVSFADLLQSATGTDNCGPVTVSHNAPDLFPLGTNFVTWTAVDTHGNSITCQQRVIVQDTQVPTLTCPADVVVNADSGACFASNVTLGNATGADNCGPVTVSHNAPAQFPVGTNFVTWTATDAHGNSITCQQRVVVRDTQAPVVNCPNNISRVSPPGQSDLIVSYPAPDVSDNCFGVVATCLPPSGSLFAIGSTTVTCSASDAADNTANCSFTVVVIRGNYPPVANDQAVTTPQDTPVFMTLTGSDADGDPLTFIVVANPLSGTLSAFDPVTGVIVYTPNPGFLGDDSFLFRVNDGTANSATATVSINVTPQADVAILKAGDTEGHAGQNLNYTVTVTNLGPSAANNVVVSDQLPSSYTFVSAFPAPTSAVNGLVTWPPLNLAAHESMSFAITAIPTRGGVFTNVALGTNSLPDPEPANNDGSWTNSQVITFVQPLVDLAVYKTGPASVPVGGRITYTITVTNRGPSGATNTVVHDSLPAGATLESASGNYVLENGVVRWMDVTLASSASATYRLTVVAPLAGVLTNVASGSSSTPEAFPGDNDGSSTNSRVITVVEPLADLAVFKAGPAEVTPGQIFPYTVTVTNCGPVAAFDVVVQDLLPAGVVCLNASGGGALAGGVVTWPASAVLEAGASRSFSLTVKAPGSGQFTNVARASSSTPDPDLSNNNGTAVSSQAITTVIPGEFGILQGANWLNPQTGLFEQRVTVTNMGSITLAAFRLLVGEIRSTDGTPRTNVFLANATGTNVDGRPYVQYNAPLNPGNQVTMVLEFRVPDRRPFTNSLEALAVLPEPATSNEGAGVRVDRLFWDQRFEEKRLVIEWTSIPGRTYTIIYSDTGPAGPWLVATPSITAAANRVQWYDDGPPKTVSQPAAGVSRFYRIIEALANP